MPDLWLLSKPWDIAALWPVSIYTTLWQSHVCEKTYLSAEHPEAEAATALSQVKSFNHYTTKPYSTGLPGITYVNSAIDASFCRHQVILCAADCVKAEIKQLCSCINMQKTDASHPSPL